MTGILQALLSFFGVSGSSSANYIEDVFSTYLYTGTGATQTITNGIDLSGKGGLLWIKNRTGANNNILFDTSRGANNYLYSNLTNASAFSALYNQSFTTSGFGIGSSFGEVNATSNNYVSWTFRKQAKFFDVVTYTGNGSNRTISHSLGSVPGCIIVKRTDTAADWQVYHRGLANTEYLVLNDTATKNTGATRWNSTTPTSTVFSLGTDTTVNANGGTYVAYLFAHDAGGFGASGTDNVITCGSYTGNGGANTITLGYEPQWLLVKKTSVQDSTSFWSINDIMRGGLNARGNASQIKPNSTEAEDDLGGVTTLPAAIATGFTIGNAGGYNASGETYIYIAIRRGPMKTPTSGTSVFGLNARTGTGAIATVTGSTGVGDAVLIKNRGSAVGDLFAARLTGTGYLETSSDAAEVAAGTTILQANPWDVMDGVKVGTTSTITNASANTFINYLFCRAPGFFDVVCYTGNGSTQSVNHNLSVAPELIIVKWRSGGATAYGWRVYQADLGITKWGQFTNDAFSTASSPYPWDTPTSSVFKLGDGATWLSSNGSGKNFVAYLFATVPGVSKVGSYTGTGTTQTINCGFTAGARFVLIKRTDSTGDWYVWDSARGIVAGNDPYLLLNSTAAEVTNTDYVDTANSGFEISSTAPAAINANGGTFIFLAIA
jgi:hypothetical protein